MQMFRFIGGISKSSDTVYRVPKCNSLVLKTASFKKITDYAVKAKFLRAEFWPLIFFFTK
jgi:hypothetical protein